MQPETKAYFTQLIDLINRTRVEFGQVNSKLRIANEWLDAKGVVSIPTLTLQEFYWLLEERLKADWVLPGHREVIKSKSLLVALYMGPITTESFVKAFDDYKKECSGDSWPSCTSWRHFTEADDPRG